MSGEGTRTDSASVGSSRQVDWNCGRMHHTHASQCMATVQMIHACMSVWVEVETEIEDSHRWNDEAGCERATLSRLHSSGSCKAAVAAAFVGTGGMQAQVRGKRRGLESRLALSPG